MIPIKFFDANARLIPTPQSFPRTQRPEAVCRTAEALEKEMRNFGITRALVYNAKCMWLHPKVGNYELIQHIAGRPGLYPSWVLLPSLLPETGSTPALLDEMEENGVKAVRLNPGYQWGHGLAYTLDGWCVGELLSGLEDRGFPVFVDTVDRSALNQICEEHSDLPIIASLGAINARVDYPLLRRHENLYALTPGSSSHMGLEEVIDVIGADRIIFSTLEEHASSIVSPACWVNQLLYADLSRSEMRLIASGNLERLLGKGAEKELPDPMAGVEISEIEKLARSGSPLKGCDVIDAHVHVGKTAAFYRPDPSSRRLLSVMDKLGVTKACINHWFAMFGDMVRGNDEVTKLISSFPGRFIGIGVIDPNYSRMAMEAEIKRCVEILGFRIIKVHPAHHFHDVPILDPRYEPVWEGAKKYGYVILIHTSKGGLVGYERTPVEPKHAGIIAGRHPQVTFIFAHAGNNYPGLLECIEIVKQNPNVYLDTATGALIAPGAIEMTVKELGADRILFGSDANYMSMAWTIGSVLYAKISDGDKRKILGGNISRLLKQACMNVEQVIKSNLE